jgi:hypothetical protein
MITGGTRPARSYYVDDDGTRLKGKYFPSVSWLYLRLRCLGQLLPCRGKQTKKPLTWANAFTTRRIVIPRLSINLYHVTKDGWKKIHAIDVNEDALRVCGREEERHGALKV